MHRYDTEMERCDEAEAGLRRRGDRPADPLNAREGLAVRRLASLNQIVF